MSRNALRSPVLGDDFRDARRRAGLTQTKIAESARISQASVSEVENGRGGMVAALAFADVLGYQLRLVPKGIAVESRAELVIHDIGQDATIPRGLDRVTVERAIRVPWYPA